MVAKNGTAKMVMNNTLHKVVIGDARQMGLVKDNSVQLVVTSPPYWQLKDYGTADQIGFHDSYENYINHLNLVWDECYRVLDGGCRLCINIGDQFARAVYYGRYKVIPIKIEIIKFCESIGFDYMGTIIWQKQITMNTTGGGSVMGSYPYPRNGIIKIDYESILLFKKTGKPSRVIDTESKQQSRLTNKEWNTYFCGHWYFKGARQDKHLAMFPVELPTRLIKMFSFMGETVLDPFLGSGTTSLAALNLDRNSIGYELNENFRAVISEKLAINNNNDNNDLVTKYKVDFSIDKTKKSNEQEYKNRINKLPYQFKDMVKLTRKIDPKKNTYGSKIDGNDSGFRIDALYNVRQIISADRLLLSNGKTIKLMGIKPIREAMSDAVDFIAKKTKGQKVFIKFDQERYNTAGDLLCYLYLANKTLINAHLIKLGLVSVDTEIAHHYLNKFIKYEEENHG